VVGWPEQDERQLDSTCPTFSRIQVDESHRQAQGGIRPEGVQSLSNDGEAPIDLENCVIRGEIWWYGAQVLQGRHDPTSNETLASAVLNIWAGLVQIPTSRELHTADLFGGL